MKRKAFAYQSFTSGFILFLTAIFFQSAVVFSEVSLRRICSQSTCYRVEVARTPEQRLSGLMGRENLEEDTGMLLVFDKDGEYPIWMKNMKIPLDLVWLDSSLTVVKTQENVQPCIEEPCPVYRPHVDARYVLEIGKGSIRKDGIVIGSAMEFENF